MKLGLRIWILIIAILFSLLAIHPTFEKGVQITNIQFNSTASEYGLTSGEIIKSINGNQIQSLADYSKFMSETFPSEQEIKLIINTKENSYILFTNETPEITVKNLPKTKVQTGLDLQGGSRALVTTEEKINAQELNDLIAVTSNRLNVYGLSDMSIRPVSDLSGENYMLIEIAGSTPKELQNLISQQGEFEAKISNQTVFVGGNKDVTYVARTGENAGIYSCDNYDSGYVCQFRFSISLSEEAAQRQADATKNLSLSPENPGYLNEKLELYLDGKYVSDLLISKSLQGQVTTQIQISGSGTGATKQEAYENAEAEMKHLQTVLITGSLPYKLQIVKLDTISPLLGEQFITTILLAGLGAVLVVAFIVLLRYRNIKISGAIFLTMASEIILTFGIASLIKWNLDLPSIAGIIATIGTGVDDQIVILDESQNSKTYSVKERIKRALFIIFGSYFTVLFSLLPLYWAGAGLLKGFAVTTIIGVSVGVFITRPAFAEIIKRITKE